MSGASVVRAFGAEALFQKQFQTFQDAHSALFYTKISTTRWIRLTLELITDLYISLVLLYFVLFSKGKSLLPPTAIFLCWF
jgi:hypothetical protein